MITFPVNDVVKATELLELTPYKVVLERLFQKPVEGFPTHKLPIIDSEFKHPFIGTVWTAFNLHYPLVLSPDMIWLLIVQGFATHISKNAEKMRHTFVQHKGKKTLTVRADNFIKGQNNDWKSVFPQFTAQIGQYLKTDISNVIITDFSTTTPTEKAVFELTLMEAMSEFFEYRAISLCGIPEITLLGTVEDWEKIVKHTENLAQYDLQWWTNSLIPILEQFVAAAKGNPNNQFWQSIFKFESGSGHKTISGWLVQFFPYVEYEILGNSGKELLARYQQWIEKEGYISVHKRRQKRENGYISEIHTCKNPSLFRNYQGEIKKWAAPSFDVKDLLKGTTATPFIWEVRDNRKSLFSMFKFLNTKTYPMEFLAGFVGMSQDAITLTLKPEIGWAVAKR